MEKLILIWTQILNLISPTVNNEVSKIPIVVNTWAFTDATIQAWDSIYHQKKSAVSFLFLL